MIGALIGFGLDAGLAIVAVLTYRLFAFWLPIGPGVVAYLAAAPRGAHPTPATTDPSTLSGIVARLR